MGFTLQGVGPFLQWMTLGALCVFPVLAAFVIYKLGSLPGSIAQVMRITSWTNYLFFSA